MNAIQKKRDDDGEEQQADRLKHLAAKAMGPSAPESTDGPAIEESLEQERLPGSPTSPQAERMQFLPSALAR
jgi:hypothetical protein